MRIIIDWLVKALFRPENEGGLSIEKLIAILRAIIAVLVALHVLPPALAAEVEAASAALIAAAADTWTAGLVLVHLLLGAIAEWRARERRGS